VIVSNLLVQYFGSPSSPSSFLNFLFTGSNVEKLKKWKAVERCMEKRWKEEDLTFRGVTRLWVDLLSHALLDTNVSRE
jgi:hypothetical protein